jgi:hypothetical protein
MYPDPVSQFNNPNTEEEGDGQQMEREGSLEESVVSQHSVVDSILSNAIIANRRSDHR